MQIIAYAHGGADAALILSRLEGHGIRAFAADFHTHVTQSQLAQALGGIRIAVFDADAAAARALIAADGPPRWRRPGWALLLFFALAGLTGTPPPALGLTPVAIGQGRRARNAKTPAPSGTGAS